MPWLHPSCSSLQCLIVSGILAYADGQPVAWCCLGPREEFPVLERWRILKRVDDDLDTFVYTDLAFRRAGPAEVTRRSAQCPIMRCAVQT